ncbi:MAG: hypothetical protein L6Q98_20345 [Anaerolineae bacterium]|nr:hypothetical protein [Anaerolineae bacterium]NUQ07055.1 hypothetical protein [Anaerolineae bacterium]
MNRLARLKLEVSSSGLMGAALQQRRIADAMPTNPAAMQPSQTGALEAADGVFSVAESSAGLGAR